MGKKHEEQGVRQKVPPPPQPIKIIKQPASTVITEVSGNGPLPFRSYITNTSDRAPHCAAGLLTLHEKTTHPFSTLHNQPMSRAALAASKYLLAEEVLPGDTSCLQQEFTGDDVFKAFVTEISSRKPQEIIQSSYTFVVSLQNCNSCCKQDRVCAFHTPEHIQNQHKNLAFFPCLEQGLLICLYTMKQWF